MDRSAGRTIRNENIPAPKESRKFDSPVTYWRKTLDDAKIYFDKDDIKSYYIIDYISKLK